MITGSKGGAVADHPIRKLGNFISYLFSTNGANFTPTPNQNENAKTTARSNFDAEAFGDMFSTLYNRI